jgi:hypothetical protein
MDAFVAGAVVCAIIRYDGDSDDCRGASQGVAQYLCDEVGEHPAAYSMVCGSHESLATWCRMLRRYGEELETTFRTVSTVLEEIDCSQHLRGNKVSLEQASSYDEQCAMIRGVYGGCRLVGTERRS